MLGRLTSMAADGKGGKTKRGTKTWGRRTRSSRLIVGIELPDAEHGRARPCPTRPDFRAELFPWTHRKRESGAPQPRRGSLAPTVLLPPSGFFVRQAPPSRVRHADRFVKTGMGPPLLEERRARITLSAGGDFSWALSHRRSFSSTRDGSFGSCARGVLDGAERLVEPPRSSLPEPGYRRAPSDRRTLC